MAKGCERFGDELGDNIGLGKSCSCSFCLKATHMWMDLTIQDSRGRVSVLQRSKKRASDQIVKFNHEFSKLSKSANVEFDHMQNWKMIFSQTQDSLAHQITLTVNDKSFGFDTAVEEAQRAINAAHVEVESVENGVGIVKLMGRYSGFIAMHATLASRDVDCCLIPESPFYLEGKGGLYEFIEQRLKENGHMVIVLAEGAGQDYVAQNVGAVDEKDKSGNRLLLDVGLWLSQKVKDHFTRDRKLPVYLKYIDPTYMIRAIPSNASDNIYCTLLAQSAVHGAMAGFTGFTVGPVNGKHAYIPISRVTEATNVVKVTDRMWARLLASTNQPSFFDCSDEARKMVDQETLDLMDRMRINSL